MDDETSTGSLVVPPEWERLDLSLLKGLVMVVGGVDAGKSTFARWLWRRLDERLAGGVSFLDGDPGQSFLGPPATVTLASGSPGEGEPLSGPGLRLRRRFVGSTSPVGHMLPLLAGTARLVEVARRERARAIVYDTTGLVDPRSGGTAYKTAAIDLLRPAAVVAIQRNAELEPLLGPLRRSRRAVLRELRPSPEVRRRDVAARQLRRAGNYAEYFRGAADLRIDASRFAVIPEAPIGYGKLIALEDAAGFTLALGIALEPARPAGILTLRTPMRTTAGIDTLRLGDLRVDPETFRDEITR